MPVMQISTPAAFFSMVPQSFFPPPCSNVGTVGTLCHISNTRCALLQPCANNGTCENTNSTKVGYRCQCSSDFDGAQCQLDHRPCQPDTCWNQGEISLSILTDGLMSVFRNVPYHHTEVLSLCLCPWLGGHSLPKCQQSLSRCSMFKRWCLSPITSQLHL